MSASSAVSATAETSIRSAPNRRVSALRSVSSAKSRIDEEVYFNACRHRGAQLGCGRGSFRGGQIACPWHGWRWKLDGANSYVDADSSSSYATDPAGHGWQSSAFIGNHTIGFEDARGGAEPARETGIVHCREKFQERETGRGALRVPSRAGAS
jgi:nitrite reductase/ring-hydroxylating ferredoxin subunit